jgi:hypothetical protein
MDITTHCRARRDICCEEARLFRPFFYRLIPTITGCPHYLVSLLLLEYILARRVLRVMTKVSIGGICLVGSVEGWYELEYA